MDNPDARKGEEEKSTAKEAAAQSLQSTAPTACLSCGATTVGGFCSNCGQKNDDLRRSSFFLARDFIEDTFSFDSRMWRTLGSLAVKPGLVPSAYAHGKRSRYTPPVRLFLVVSFLFFLALSVTDTMFVAVYVEEPEQSTLERLDPARGALMSEALVEAGADLPETQCNLETGLKFFVRPGEIENNLDLWARCMAKVEEASEVSGASPATAQDGGEVSELVLVLAGGMSKAVENPRAFNAAFNAWLPRVLLLMTPISALILSMFIRGRGVLFFDHLVLAFYSHAVGFAALGMAIIFAQAGARWAMPAAAALLGIYLIGSLKRAYGRGWVKTIWTAVAGGALYFGTLMLIVLAIVLGLIIQG